MPKFLKEIMQSNAYTNKNDTDYQGTNEIVTNYLKMLYPGEMKLDATGRMQAPEYDMTLEQFQAAQAQIESDFEEAKQEAEDEISESLPDDVDFDIENYVVLEETIPVRILYSDGSIDIGYLEIYDLDLPDGPTENDGPGKKWVWHTDGGDGTCEECESLDGQEFESEDELPECPLHPNCNCWIEEIEMDDKVRPIKSTRMPPKVNGEKKSTEENKNMKSDDIKFEKALEKTMGIEGKFTDGKKQIKDQPTNMGIQQETLNKYNQKFPDKNFPQDVKDLKPEQAKEIYKREYWDNTNIPKIENERIRNAVFDMNAMSIPSIVGKTVQNSLNTYTNAELKVDGIMGSKTINAINSITNDKVASFMEILKAERMESLQKMSNWPTAKGGWTTRTMAY